jgi:hypothetical protein
VNSIWDSAFSDCTSLMAVYFEGNAPNVYSGSENYDIFQKADSLIVYYLPGAIGWGPLFSGRPTALWLPRVLTNDPSFGVSSNQFGFNIHWATDKQVVVEASPSLGSPDWAPVSTNTVAAIGTIYFADSDWANYPTRYYRIRSQ